MNIRAECAKGVHIGTDSAYMRHTSFAVQKHQKAGWPPSHEHGTTLKENPKYVFIICRMMHSCNCFWRCSSRLRILVFWSPIRPAEQIYAFLAAIAVAPVPTRINL